MSVNSEMTAIADLIRGLRGVSGKMGLDAMKGHLQDEQDGLDSALAALAEKGVTVPAGTKVDGLAALIAAIEAGGGSGGGAFATGTYTAVEQVTASTVNITHGLGVIPKTIMWFVTAPIGTVTTSRPVLALFCDEYSCAFCTNATSSTTSNMQYHVLEKAIGKLYPTEETIRLCNSGSISSGSIKEGFTVTWAVWG